MTSSIEQELEKIDQLILKGEYFEVLDEIKKIRKNKDITPEEVIKTKIAENQAELWLGVWYNEDNRVEKSVSLADEAFKESSKLNNMFLIAKSLASKSLSLWYIRNFEELLESNNKFCSTFEKLKSTAPDSAKKLEPNFYLLKAIHPIVSIHAGREVAEGFWEKSINLLEKGLKISEKQQNLYLKKYIIWVLGYCEANIQNQEKHLHYRQEFAKISEEIGNKYFYGQSLYLISIIYSGRDEHEKYFELNMQRLKLYEDMGFEEGIMSAKTSIAVYYLEKGDKNQALEIVTQSLDFYKQKNDEHFEGVLLNFIGYIHRLKGELDLAFKYIKQAYDILTVTRGENWWWIINPLSEIYILMGELDEALKLQEEILVFYKGASMRSGIVGSLYRIGRILWQKGFRDQAINKVRESAELVEVLDNEIWFCHILTDLIYFLTEIDEVDEAGKYLSKFEKINSKLKSRELEQKYSYAEALVLRKSSDARDKIKADVILERLLREDLSYEFQLAVQLVLCEMLLLELQATGDSQILSRIQKYILDLYSLTAGNNSYILSSEILLLQAKLALVELDTEKTKELLDKAEKIAEEKGLDRLKENISQERLNIEGEIGRIEKLDKTAPLSERIEAVDFKKSMNGIKKTSITDVNAEETESSRRLFSIQI